MLKLYYTGSEPRGAVEVSFNAGETFVTKTLAELREGVDIGDADTADIKVRAKNAITDNLSEGEQVEISGNELVIKNITINQTQADGVPVSEINSAHKVNDDYYRILDTDGDHELTREDAVFYKDRGGAYRKETFDDIENTDAYVAKSSGKVFYPNFNSPKELEPNVLGVSRSYSDSYVLENVDGKFQKATQINDFHSSATNGSGNAQSFSIISDGSYFMLDSTGWHTAETSENSYVNATEIRDGNYYYYFDNGNPLTIHDADYPVPEYCSAVTVDERPGEYFAVDSAGYISDSYSVDDPYHDESEDETDDAE